MPFHLTTAVLVVLTLLSLAASALAWLRLWRPRSAWAPATAGPQRILLLACGLGAIGLFAYRALMVHEGWYPFEAHVDGLLLMAGLVAMTVLFLQAPSRVPGTAPFALPVLTVLLAWAICASSFTLEGFAIRSVWNTIHLTSVYLGTFFLAVAAVAGGMFLYAQRRLRAKQAADSAPMASLEAIESLIVRTSALGFAILSLGLITGLVIVTSSADNKLGPGWWHSPKVLLATAVWLLYAVIVNVRHTTSFRGARAAWLSIAGLVLLMATFGVVTTMEDHSATPSDTEPREPMRAAPATHTDEGVIEQTSTVWFERGPRIAMRGFNRPDHSPRTTHHSPAQEMPCKS